MLPILSLNELENTTNDVVKNTKDEKTIEYNCNSCGRCVNKHCSFFNRYVNPSYNKCANHTNYVEELDIHYVSPDIKVLDMYAQYNSER